MRKLATVLAPRLMAYPRLAAQASRSRFLRGGISKDVDEAVNSGRKPLFEADETLGPLSAANILMQSRGGEEEVEIASIHYTSDEKPETAATGWGAILDDSSVYEGTKLCMSTVYNDNSEAQANAAAFLTTFLRRAAASVHASLPQGVPLEVCEYGCSTGGSSILPLRSIQDAATGRSLRVSMNDLPMNGWSILKKTVEPDFPEIEFSYKPKSMYGQVTNKEGTLHLAYSCYAQHWLRDGAPTGLPDGAIWASQLPRDNPYRRIWEQDSKQQWADLLVQRAREMAAGGMMVFHIESAKCCGKLSQGFAETLQRAKLAMIENGELSDEEALSMVCPEFSKTPADILAPLVNGPIMQLWEVVEVQYQEMPCPYLEEFEARQQVDPESTCEKLLGVIRAFMDTSIVECVGEEKADSYWKHVQRIADNDPKKLSSDFTGTFVSLRRSSVPVAVPVSPSKITV